MDPGDMPWTRWTEESWTLAEVARRHAMQPGPTPQLSEEDQAWWDAGAAVARVVQKLPPGPHDRDVAAIGFPPIRVEFPPRGDDATKFWVLLREKADELRSGVCVSGHNFEPWHCNWVKSSDAVYRCFRTEPQARLFLAGYQNAMTGASVAF